MAIIIALLSFLLEVFRSIFSKQLADEFKAWTPSWVDYLLKVAVAKLPSERRERLAEEWKSDVSRCPGEIGKIWMALGCIVAARKISASHNAAPDLAKPANDILELLAIRAYVIFIWAYIVSIYIAVWLIMGIVLTVIVSILTMDLRGMPPFWLVIGFLLSFPVTFYLMKQPSPGHDLNQREENQPYRQTQKVNL
jgi:hypothetical protein